MISMKSWQPSGYKLSTEVEELEDLIPRGT
jgi:hypothetical protein